MMRVPVLTGRRAAIVKTLQARPGLSRRALAAALGAEESSLSYHLHVLVRERVVIAELAGRSAALFVNGSMPPSERRLALLHDEAKAILALLRATPGTLRCCDIAARSGLARSRARSFLESLERAGLARRSAYGKWEAA